MPYWVGEPFFRYQSVSVTTNEKASQKKRSEAIAMSRMSIDGRSRWPAEKLHPPDSIFTGFVQNITVGSNCRVLQELTSWVNNENLV